MREMECLVKLEEGERMEAGSLSTCEKWVNRKIYTCRTKRRS